MPRTVGTKVTELSVFNNQSLWSMCAVVLRTEASSSMMRCAYECLNDYDCVRVFWHPEKRVCHFAGHGYLSGTRTCFDAGFKVMNDS